MKLCLIYRQDATATDAASSYVTRLIPALADDHRTAVVAIGPGLTEIAGAALALRKRVEREPPDILHVNGVSGIALGARAGAFPPEGVVWYPGAIACSRPIRGSPGS